MNASKLMKVTYFDPKSDIRLLCYADTVVWDTKPAPTLIALRFGGYPERVQGLADAIYGGATIEIEDDMSVRFRHRCARPLRKSWPRKSARRRRSGRAGRRRPIVCPRSGWSVARPAAIGS